MSDMKSVNVCHREDLNLFAILASFFSAIGILHLHILQLRQTLGFTTY